MARLQKEVQAAGTTGSAGTSRRIQLVVATLDEEVAMGIRKKRSTRSKLGSLGRPPVAGRAEQQKFWRGIAA
ncbi:hypothetical protein ACQR1N_25550, partial [Bradyrhizobium sp. HKCCYLRH1073]|uniref:hypothetical protein n=1 Tax=unclassified Bradyrhizobium TaxID=2631580 RepID=UPI0028EBB822